MDRACPLCDSSKYHALNFLIEDERRFNNKASKVSIDDLKEIELVLCDTCSLVYYRKFPPTLFEIYTNTYRKKIEFVSNERLIENAAKSRLWGYFLGQFLKKGAKVLDVGCAEGFFVQYLNKIGCQGEGIDINELSINEAQKNKLDVHMSDIKDFRGGPYDIIFNSGYLEHVFDPGADMRAMWNLLKPNGIIYTQTPNVLCPNRAFLSEFFAPEHVQTFSFETLDDIHLTNGFEPLFYKSDVYNYGQVLISKKTDKPTKKIKLKSDVNSTLTNLVSIQKEYKNYRDKKPYLPITDFLKTESYLNEDLSSILKTNYGKFHLIVKLLNQLTPDYKYRLFSMIDKALNPGKSNADK